MSAVLDVPKVDRAPVESVESLLTDVVPCAACDAPARVVIIHRCCRKVTFGCVSCTSTWETGARGGFILAPQLGRQPRCGPCGALHDTFDSEFEVGPL